MAFVNLICAECGISFSKTVASYNTGVRGGVSKFFCNRQCLGKSRTNKIFYHSVAAQINFWDEQVFQTDMEAKYYLLGYLCADGYVAKEKKTDKCREISVSSADVEILYKIKNRFKMTKDIRLITKAKDNHKDLFSLSFSSLIAKQIIESGYGACLKKDRECPEVPDEYFFYFARGYIDGDGYIRFYSDCKKPYIKGTIVSYICHDKFNEKFTAQLCRLSGAPRKDRCEKERKNLRLLTNKYSGPNSRRILNLIYKDATIYMERKYQHFLKAKEYYGDFS